MSPQDVANSSAQGTWEVDDTWANAFTERSVSKIPEEIMQQAVDQYIGQLYPDCARRKSIVFAPQLPKDNGSPHTYSGIYVFDDDALDVLLSATLIVNLPADADATPGTWLKVR